MVLLYRVREHTFRTKAVRAAVRVKIHRLKAHMTTSFNIQNFYMYLGVLYGYQYKRRLFSYTALTDWFL